MKPQNEFRAIVAEAFAKATWGNTTDTVDTWIGALENGSDAEKFAMFEKVFREDPDGQSIRALFTFDQRKNFVAKLTKPFSRAHLEKRRKVYRAVYLGEKQDIPELSWIRH